MSSQQKSYILGQEVRVKATFTDMDDAPVDPTVATIIIRSPNGAETSYIYGDDVEVVKESTGIYYVDFVPTAAGYWRSRGKGTGAATGAGEDLFVVNSTRFSS